MNFKNILIVGAVSLGLWSCKTALPAPQDSRTDVKEMVNNPEATLVDVRIPAQFAEKTAPGAINIPLASIEENLDFFRKQKEIVVFCNTGRQSSEAMEILKKNGITNVYNAKSLQNIEAIQKQKK